VPLVKPKDNLPLNEYLAQRRKFLKFRLGDLAQKTNIAPKYLKWIEGGEWQNLPPGVYARSFLKKYAQAVGLDESEILFRYEEEQAFFESKALINQTKDSLLVSKENSSPLKIFCNIKALNFLSHIETRYIMALVIGVAVAGYIIWQLRVIFVIPELVINFPSDEITLDQTVLILDGKASPDSLVTVNGESIFPQQDGSFKKETQLLPGLNVFEIKAVSRFGKEKKVVRRVTYQP